MKQEVTAGADTGATEVLKISEPKQKKIPSKTWRECIKKFWEVDPLECPKCGSEMKIISFIDERLLNIFFSQITTARKLSALLECRTNRTFC